jgi:zinc protease
MRKLLLLLVLLGCAVSIHAQNKLPDNFYMKKLGNGLEILVIEDNSVPLATIEICVHNGAYTESPEFDGLSHLYEHMFFKANKDIPSQEEFLARVRELGISFNGTTSNERVNYFVTLSNEKVKEGVEFMNSAIRYPLFLEEEMKKENPVVDGEFQRAESNPVFFLINDLNRHMWGDHYSRKNVIGDHDIILTATTEKMQTIQNKYYYPNNSIIVIAGDVEHEKVFNTVNEVMGDWKPSDFEVFEKYPVPEFEPLKESSYYITENENARIPIIVIGLHGPDTRNDVPATYAADVFSFILGQKTSRLQKELVDKGLALQVQISYQTCKFVGPINIFLVPAPGKTKEAYDALMEQVAMWDNDDYFTDEQLETAKTLLAIEDTYGKESTSSFVHTVTFWWASADIDYYTSYVENLKKVTRDDIKRYVQTYIKGKPSVTGMLLTKEMKEQMEIEDVSDYFNP